jgi:hypothetical protein
MEVNILEQILGKDRFEKEERFNRALLEIEEKYIDFFRKRPAKNEIELHDRLHDHWLMLSDNYKISFGFEKDTDIPQEIIIRCFQKFNEIFRDL